MSEALYGLGGLRFWTEKEILARDHAIEILYTTLKEDMCKLNPAWDFRRIEGPLLTPRNHISASYDESDIFLLKAQLGEEEAALRAETTASSYAYAKFLLDQGRKGARLPLCVWQAGKSFRREAVDGARFSTLRLNEFYQCEFQFIYSNTTTAPLRETAEASVSEAIRRITRSKEVRMVDSDRLPSYATQTRDVEAPFRDNWKEMCSISTRTDFPVENTLVLEVAVGLDRLIIVESEN